MINLKNQRDYGLLQWLCRARAAAYSSGAPENPGRFAKLNSSIDGFKTAPSYEHPDVQKVVERVHRMVIGENYFSDGFLKEVDCAIGALTDRFQISS